MNISQAPVRILISDQRPVFRQGIRALIELQKKLTISTEAWSFCKIETSLRNRPTKILILGISEKDWIKELKALEKICDRFPKLKVITICQTNNQLLMQKLALLNIWAILDNTVEDYELIMAVSQVLADVKYMSKIVSEKFLVSGAIDLSSLTNDQQLFGRISKRELEVLQLVVNEMTTPEIADKLCIATKTVHTHRMNLRQKTKSRNTAGLVKFAMRHGLAS